MHLIRKYITLGLLQLARQTANTSAAKYYTGMAIEYEGGL